MFDCVVNHYFRRGFPEKVRSSAMLSASCLRAEPEVGQVFLVDGSPTADEDLRHWAQATGIEYVHSGRELSFSGGYNLGASLCRSEWVVLCASDVYVSAGFFSKASAYLSQVERVGCAVPWLSASALPTQRPRRAGRPAEIPLMTLNLNIFRAETLKALGGINPSFTGNYNDVELVLNLRKMGLKIFLLPVLALHYGRMTVGSGSTVSLEADRKLFREKYPAMYLEAAFWELRLSSFIDRPWQRGLARLMEACPPPLRSKMQSFLLDRILLL